MASRRLTCPSGLVAELPSPAIVIVAGLTSTSLANVVTVMTAGAVRSSSGSTRKSVRAADNVAIYLPRADRLASNARRGYCFAGHKASQENGKKLRQPEQTHRPN